MPLTKHERKKSLRDSMKGELVSLLPECRICGKFLCIPMSKNGRRISWCRSCDHFVYITPRWYERLMFWKLSNGQMV